MKNVFYIVVLIFLVTGCASTLYPEYTLKKKYPLNIVDLDLQILNDTTGVFINKENKSLKQNFGFTKKKRNFLIITYTEGDNEIVSLKNGDTLVYHKKDLYLFNVKHKLVFTKKE